MQQNDGTMKMLTEAQAAEIRELSGPRSAVE